MPVSTLNPTQQIAGCGRACPGTQLKAQLPTLPQHRKASWVSLMALFLPGLLFGAGLVLLRDHPQFTWLHRAADYPWQFWTIALSGFLATAAGFGDWAYHRWAARCVVGRAERNCELLALAGGGVPMFLLMSLASLSPRPLQFLVPALIVLLFTATLICYDEFIFHRRRCRRLETVLHRLLVFGNGLAWLAWAHWCFVQRGSYG
jgi:hypothetical protein